MLEVRNSDVKTILENSQNLTDLDVEEIMSYCGPSSELSASLQYINQRYFRWGAHKRISHRSAF